MTVCAKPWSLALKARCVSCPLPSCWAVVGRRFPPPRNGKRSSCSVMCCGKILARAHYVICNADESEPGTFKDRILMEGDPFAVLEGMTIAGFVTGARKGYIYLRGEYPLAAERMQLAIESANENGFLGDNILGSGLQFNIEIRRGAGAYICGEETALFNSIEGYRGEPRNKPPFPTQSGLFRQPTAVNNVETLVNVPGIILERRRCLRQARHGTTPPAPGSFAFADTWRGPVSTKSPWGPRCANSLILPEASLAAANCRRFFWAARPELLLGLRNWIRRSPLKARAPSEPL